MSENIIRKAATGEPGNPGQFGSHDRADSAVSLVPVDTEAMIVQAIADAEKHQGAATLSMVTEHGTAMSEATLCPGHFRDSEFRRYAEANGLDADDAPEAPRWAPSSDDNAVACVECSIDEQIDDLLGEQ